MVVVYLQREVSRHTNLPIHIDVLAQESALKPSFLLQVPVQYLELGEFASCIRRPCHINHVSEVGLGFGAKDRLELVNR